MNYTVRMSFKSMRMFKDQDTMSLMFHGPTLKVPYTGTIIAAGIQDELIW